MAIVGRDALRVDLPGAPNLVVVSVRWVQRAYNGWAGRAGPIAEDGVFGDQTLLALNRLAQALYPSALTILPTEDRRSVTIDRPLEQKIAGLVVTQPASSSSSRQPDVDFTPRSTHPITDAGETYIVPETSTPAWAYALGIVAFAASAGLTYVALAQSK